MSSSKMTPQQIHSPRKTGMLMKLGGKIKISWQQRYFMLKDNFLYYCKSPTDTDACRFIDIRNYSVSPADNKTGKKYTIGLFSHSMKTYYLQAADMDDFNEWLAALQQRETQKLGVDDFEFLSVIGKGSFGKVMLVKRKSDGGIFAMKILRKDAMVAKSQVKNTMSERHILQKIVHPFLVGLQSAFQSEDKLYMVLDYVDGGELFFHLQKESKFSEDRSRLYSAEIILGLDHLHTMDIIYRDLKPENILLDNEGHVRLTDFGLAKQTMGWQDKTQTFCGTPEYLAPEILKEEGHGKGVDWWSLGTLLYEMMAGLPPFYSQNVNVMYENILHGELKFPKHFSPEACDLLKKLLDRNPDTRLGSGPDGSQDIQKHPFFKKLDWQKVYNRGYIPEFKPTVTSAGDVSNFDTAFTSEQAVDSVVEGSRISAAHAAEFEGFTFVADSAMGK